MKTAFPEFGVRSASERDGLRWMHIGTDDTYIALNETRTDRRLNSEPYNGDPGVNHLGYEVDDVDALRARLGGSGALGIQPIRTNIHIANASTFTTLTATTGSLCSTFRISRRERKRLRNCQIKSSRTSARDIVQQPFFRRVRRLAG